MATPPDPSRPGRGRVRRTRALVIGVAVTALLAGAVPFFESAADAVPPLCPDGSPPPCDIPDTTTRPTTTTVVSNPVWTTRVNVLDQSPVPVAKPVVGSWGRAGTPYSTPINPVVWSATSPNEGTVGLQNTTLPGTGLVAFRLVEQTLGGRLCRGFPFGAISGTGKTTHVLTAPTSLTTPTALNAMAQSLVGPSDAIDDADVTITRASLVPRNDGLFLDIGVHVYADLQDPLGTIDADFGYQVLLHVSAGTSLDLFNEVMTVHADKGVLVQDGHNTTTGILLWFAGDLEPTFRDIVAEQARDAINNAVSAQADVQWFRALGYVVSARRVTTTTAGLEVLPSLCKVDF